VKRNGWDLVDVHIDDDRSAYSGKARPEYQRLLDDLRSGVLDVVVAWHPDRLHRSPRELEDFIDVIEAAGATVATVTAGDLDLSTPDGRLTARITGSVARKESEDKSRRLRRKHVELAEAGKVSGGGRRPFGFEKDRLTIRPDEADLIREAAERILAGDSIRSVATDWKARGVATVTGAAWQPATVKRMLTSGRISGQREHHGDLVGPAVWPAIITAPDTVRLRSILSDPARNRGGGTARTYLLTGLVRCGRCDVPMSARRTGTGKRRYVCSADRGGCDRCGTSAGLDDPGERPDPMSPVGIEDLLIEAIFVRADSPKLVKALSDRQAKAGVDDQVAELEDLEGRLEQLATDHYVDQLIDRRSFLAARKPIMAKLDAVRAQLARRQRGDALAGLVGEGALPRAWPAMSFDRRRAVVEAFVEVVVIAPTDRADNRFNPTRVEVEWRV
jgi:site-specific DNA recombinase